MITDASPSFTPHSARAVRIALLGNPNTGKTTLFNLLSGLRHKTSNFPGTTQEARIGTVKSESGPEIHLIDLPGIYSIELQQPESEVCRDVLAGRTAAGGDRAAEPDAVCVVLDVTNLARNLIIAGEALRRRLPTVVVLNMMDLAQRSGLRLSTEFLAERLGCTVLAISARSGQNVDSIIPALMAAKVPNRTPPGGQTALEEWAEEIAAESIVAAPACTPGGHDDHAPTEQQLERHQHRTDRIDALLVHPVFGVLIFATVAAGIFWIIFSLARFPMDWIGHVFGAASAALSSAMPPGIINDLVCGGILNGISGVVVFVPQIALLFFVISLLEDTGYLARAAFLMDRALRPFGLPGHAFVPLLSSHACAIPGIIAARTIPDRKERLAAILVAPFMTCSARLPVYVLVTTVLFPKQPSLAALAFIGCYALGIFAGLVSALCFRRTILRGKGRPMAMELPSYKLPSLRTAFTTSYDRSTMFLRKAGTNILAISVVLWWLSSFPHVAPPARALEFEARAAQIENQPDPSGAGAQQVAAKGLREQAAELTRANARRESIIGRLGRVVQPVFQPLGYDWQLTVGVLSSFAAREVFVSTMAVVVTGHEDAQDEGVMDRLAGAHRDDGQLLFSPASSWSLLVFFALAMQCMSTLVTTARETGSWKWAMLQLGWNTGWAYLLAMIVYMLLK